MENKRRNVKALKVVGGNLQGRKGEGQAIKANWGPSKKDLQQKRGQGGVYAAITQSRLKQKCENVGSKTIKTGTEKPKGMKEILGLIILEKGEEKGGGSRYSNWGETGKKVARVHLQEMGKKEYDKN